LRPVVFLDGDSTVAEELGYLNHASRFRMFPFVAEDLRQAADWVLRQQK
jgi:D-glycero-D-manno-heptose 1,7-bisphosphate phosphatase